MLDFENVVELNHRTEITKWRVSSFVVEQAAKKVPPRKGNKRAVDSNSSANADISNE